MSFEVVVYNQNLALVRDTRSIELSDDPLAKEFHWENVSDQMDHESVMFQSETCVSLEHNYRYDLVSTKALLKRYIGKSVSIAILNRDNERLGQIVGKVLSVNDNGITAIQKEDGKVILNPKGRIELPELPGGLLTKPALVFLFQKDIRYQYHSAQLTYLTRGLSWKCNYVVTLNESVTEATILGMMTVVNDTECTFDNTQLRVVAGDIHRVRDEVMYAKSARVTKGLESYSIEPQVTESKAMDYHMYSIGRPTTLLPKESKQILAISIEKQQCRRQYIYEYGSHYGWGSCFVSDREESVTIKLDVSKVQNAIPKGTARMYADTEDGSVQFVGEDRVPHSPKGSDLLLILGKAFDIKAKRLVMDHKRSDTSLREDVKVILHNYKEDEDVTVYVDERFSGDWEVLKESHPHVKKDAWGVRFEVFIPRNSIIELEYSYFTQWE